MKRGILIGLGAVAALVVVWFVDLLVAAGSFRSLEPKSVGACRAVTGIAGAEDLTIDPRTGIVYLSAYDRRAVMRGEDIAGGIFAYDLKAAVPGLVNLTPDAGPEFQPHGISFYRGVDGKESLFVINHGSGKHTVEVFDITGDGLVLRQTIEDPALVSPNDLVAVGPSTFYVSNDHGHPTGVMRTLEDYLRLNLSDVRYYDGETFTEILSGIGGANGINVSADGKTLYLSAASERTLRVYDRDAESGALTEKAAVSLAGFVDNIELMDDGSLLVGIHPKIFDLLAHFNDPEALSPSHIVRVKPAGENLYDVETVYLDLGEAISGASVAASYDGRLVIGAIFEPKFLDCRWRPTG